MGQASRPPARPSPPVSIPQSEFCPLGLYKDFDIAFPTPWQRGFNSSVGILSVGTCEGGAGSRPPGGVSIPQSEFCPLGHTELRRPHLRGFEVSIPQSEFCPLGLKHEIEFLENYWKFQFLSRNSVRWDTYWSALVHEVWPCFNSSVGILSVGT